MRFRPSTSTAENALPIAIAALEAMEATSNIIPAVPLFGMIVSSVLGIARMIEVRPHRFGCAEMPSRVYYAD